MTFEQQQSAESAVTEAFRFWMNMQSAEYDAYRSWKSAKRGDAQNRAYNVYKDMQCRTHDALNVLKSRRAALMN